MEERPLGIRTKVAGRFDEVLARTKAELKAEGFGVLTEVDVRATMREKLGVEFTDYAIIGACNPPLAHKALTGDPEVGLLLPCNVIVYAEGDDVVVEAMDPRAVAGLSPAPELPTVAEDARARLVRALGRIEAASGG